MAVTAADLATAIRLGDSPEETAQARRLLAVATQLVTRHAPAAPADVQDEATIRVAGYLFDMPQAAAGHSYADVLRNSGALALLLPWRVHRAGVAGADDGESTTPAVASGEGGIDVQGAVIADGVLVVATDAPTRVNLPDHGGCYRALVQHQGEVGRDLFVALSAATPDPATAPAVKLRAGGTATFVVGGDGGLWVWSRGGNVEASILVVAP